MSLISRAAHRYSPAIALRLTLTPHVTHHANCLGTPATKQQLTKCATCAVTAKSRLARLTRKCQSVVTCISGI